MRRKILILDLDGVFLGMTGHHKREVNDLIGALQLLDKWQSKGGEIYIVTNRPPSEMQPLSYLLNIVRGYWITENGGSLFNVASGNAIPSQRWTLYSEKYVPELRKYLKGKVVFHPSNGFIRTMFITPPVFDLQQFTKEKIIPLMSKYNYSDRFEINVSKVASIEPKNLSKEGCFNEFILLNGLNLEKDIFYFVADSKRDVGFAKKLSKYNSHIGSVGNSSTEYSTFVQGIRGGVCAPISSTYHASLVYLLNCFMNEE